MADADSPLLRFRLWRSALPPALRLLMTLNLATYVAWLVIQFIPPVAAFVAEHFALHPFFPGLLFEPWQVLTYSVVNFGASFFGLISFVFGVMWLYWLGREYEEMYGTYRFFGLYVWVALGGALFALLLWSWQDVAELTQQQVLYAGVWAAATGVLCAAAALNPNRGMGLFLLGVVPLKWIAAGFVVLDFLFVRDPTHLGAAAFGVLFGFAQKRDVDLAAWARPLWAGASSGPYGGGYGAPSGPSMGERMKRILVRDDDDDDEPPPRRRAGRQSVRRSDPPGRTGQAEVDRILDKILEDGFDALTDEEKRILDEASRRS